MSASDNWHRAVTRPALESDVSVVRARTWPVTEEEHARQAEWLLYPNLSPGERLLITRPGDNHCVLASFQRFERSGSGAKVLVLFACSDGTSFVMLREELRFQKLVFEVADDTEPKT